VSERIEVVRCGRVPYGEASALQSRLRERRQRGEIDDVLLLLEHPPTYTRGRRSTAEELPMGVEWYERQGIEVRDTERGGRVTYHGPGQLVAYPIVSLAPYGGDVLAYVRGLERAMIAALGDFGVEAGLIEGETGVWVHGTGGPVVGPGGERRAEVAAKIGSIGLHISRGVTTHGIAINVNNDLQPFDWIVPCGIQGCSFTSVTRERGAEQDFEAFAGAFVARYAAEFEREPVAAAVAELDRPDPAGDRAGANRSQEPAPAGAARAIL
jgi:lipoyl(octanoyl) transferase